MKFFAILGLLSGLTSGFAQTPVQVAQTPCPPAVAIPLVTEKTSGSLIFRAALDGESVPIEKIDRPSDTPLRIVVIDLRAGRTAPGSPAEAGGGGPGSLDARRLHAQATWIYAGQPNPNDGRTFPGWQLETASGAAAALQRAAKILAADRRRFRQALLIIGEKPGSEENDFAAEINRTKLILPEIYLTYIFPGAAAGGDAEKVEKPAKTRLGQWWKSLDSFYLIRLGAVTERLTGGGGSGRGSHLFYAEARLKGKIIGRREMRIDLTAPPEEEVAAAFGDYSKIGSFEKQSKFSGLPRAEIEFFRNHYAPAIEGVVIAADQRQIERLRRLGAVVFRLHAVENQCETMLLQSDLPTVFTWKLTFVSLTTKTLEILSDEEITALIAHEVGHLYYAADLQSARERGDERLARIAELKCDLIACESLRRLGIRPAVLVAAVEKLIEARRAINVKSSEGGSPSLADRRQLARQYAEQAAN